MKNLKTVIAAIHYIETHLTGEKLDLDTVSAAAHYSKYHLHRIFIDMVGLSIHDYVQRRKLTEAAKLLVFSDRPIIDIAILAGYDSQQAFSNVFKAMYKESPKQFRKNEVFYPLQLEYNFKDQRESLENVHNNSAREIRLAKESDIPLWMDLVHLAIDGFPHLEEEEHLTVLKRYITKQGALLMTEGGISVGGMMINYETGSIDFLAVHPLYRKQDISRDLLNVAFTELLRHKEISITTFREGDKADTGYRKALKELGFAEAELLTEFGYPTQRMILPRKPPAFPDEIAHLDDVKRKLNDAIKQANNSVQRLDKDYMDFKRYMVQYHGEIDPHEMFQNELALKRIDSRGTFAVEIRDKLAKLLDSPYFARIDFREASQETPALFYIGRFAFSHHGDLQISDWRSPIASMFYDCELGPAGYDAPAGRIDGELTRKRQFKIKNGEMEYALESSVNIQDDILQRELSRTSDDKMKSIIATIQKEQNRIIRNEKTETLLIQGVAGSGKTSIALHRIAYLLYRFKDRLSARNVAILSPNKVLGNYISNVLPELGEQPIYGMSFADIAKVQLEGVIQFESDHDPLETEDPQWGERVRFKSTLDFIKLMDDYLALIPETIFEPSDYTFGQFSAPSEWIHSRFAAYHKHPVKRRLQMIADDIHDRFETGNFMEEPLPKARAILKSLAAMVKVKNTLALYKDFYKHMNIADKFVMPARKTLEWADVYPFMYFQAAFEGLQESPVINHLLIDEMQDYTPVQYAVMNILFKCPKTILGDFGQFINPNHLHTLGDLCKLYESAELIELNKSYRSTYEIITFAKRIQNVASLEATLRHGDAPDLIYCRSEQEELAQIKRKIDAFLNNGNVTLGIILKTNGAAKALYDILSQNCEVHLISPESAAFVNGISITSIQMSKGLEFDEVIVPAANHETYSGEYGRSLLYIACTRALHRLSLTYTSELTRLISA